MRNHTPFQRGCKRLIGLYAALWIQELLNSWFRFLMSRRRYFFIFLLLLLFRWYATDCWSLSFDEGCHRVVTSRNGRHFFGLESWSSWLFSYWNHCQYSTVQGKLSWGFFPFYFLEIWYFVSKIVLTYYEIFFGDH